ncbi:MAG: hypothetical protein KC469_02165, partial [Flavobacteriaceae bacterium]|nr:hypothetical protein [Flavobacteriaceae bacterium]
FQIGLITKPKKLSTNTAMRTTSIVKFGTGKPSIIEIKGNRRSENHILGDKIKGIIKAKKAQNLTQNNLSVLKF